MDFLPTIAKLAGAEIPQDRPIDGIDLMPALRGEVSDASEERTIFYHFDDQVNAVRKGKWILHFTWYDHSRGG